MPVLPRPSPSLKLALSLSLFLSRSLVRGAPLALACVSVERRARALLLSCSACIPHAGRERAIKRMQIKTFYLNDNITLVDASTLAQVSIINIM